MNPSSGSVTWSPAEERPPEIEDAPGQAGRRIHILGTGSIGMLVAHSLRGILDPPPISLLLHRKRKAQEFSSVRRTITLITQGDKEPRGEFDWEYAVPPYRRHGKIVSVAESERLDELQYGEYGEGSRPHEQVEQAEEQGEEDAFGKNADYPIQNLIVTLKAHMTVSGLLAVKNRLSSESTILFLQNGMGIIDEVNKEVFPDPSTRPNYMLGINSHGVHSEEPFKATHAGQGTMSLGLAPKPRSSRPSTPPPSRQETSPFSEIEMAPSSRYILRELTRCPVLAAVGLSPTELFKAQLEKLAVNAVLNPLTAIIDCRNGSLLYNFANTRNMRLLLAEISSIFIRLPELQGLPNVNTRFSSERLETLCVGVANKTAQNVSSMLADVRGGRQTEIDYINGYVVKRGEDVGITAGFNYFVMQLVKGKQSMVSKEDEEDVPFARGL